jgi:hypothetical protein
MRQKRAVSNSSNAGSSVSTTAVVSKGFAISVAPDENGSSGGAVGGCVVVSLKEEAT